MIPDFPKNESVLSWTNLSLNKTEQSWNLLISWIDDFVNSTMFGFEDKISMNYKNELFSSFILRVNERFHLENDIKQDSCNTRFIFNSFSTICLFSINSFKTIFKNPSTELRRITKLVPVSKANRFTSKTTMWLAKRPGLTIKDKISPKNNILTEITIFSKDTKENREALYLFENLYWVLGANIYNCSCANCKNDSCKKIKKYYELVKSLFSQRLLVKNEILSDVKKEKQLIANNKLISDPDYKCILDSTKKFDNFDKTYKDKWNNLEFYVVSLAKHLIASELLSFEGAKILDYYGSIKSSFSKIQFSSIGTSEIAVGDINIEIQQNNVIKKVLISQEELKIYIDITTLEKKDKKYIQVSANTIEYDLGNLLKNVESDLINRSSFIDAVNFINSFLNNNSYLKLITNIEAQDHEKFK